MLSGNSSCTPRAGDTVDAYVLRVSRDAAYVDICCEREIAIPKSKLAYPEPEFAADVVNVGDVFPVYIESLGGENGGVLSIQIARSPDCKIASLGGTFIGFEKLQRFYRLAKSYGFGSRSLSIGKISAT